MKKTYVGKAGKIKVYGTNPEKYFDKLIEKSANASKGYDEEIMLHLVEGLNKELVKEKITPYALAKKAGIRPQVVKRILNGAPNAEVNTIAKMGQSMNMHLCWHKK
ncbi:MAG TPA: helix-turn-helix transcriptional regulator [Candidatus Goldiibacteriota bacterium]|nr:helix-turn-helix transcriptional regulator [Candidatus Goldiibacteriota bacterium]HPN64364.1 helix-turn-helix transcriptional regulator [Candidatus Goldiibacteriota bacterium]HRQ42914.1 helix-turn-helix transcriptional regulator [Candidatus Goldiibacteriota bacterium]